MADEIPIGPSPYLGEIRMLAGIKIPAGWALCDGRLLSITDHEDLFALIGITYGGDGVTNFARPDLRGRVPVNRGPDYRLGQMGGEDFVTLSVDELPTHSHDLHCNQLYGGLESPAGNMWGYSKGNPYAPGPGKLKLNPDSIAEWGLSEPHENRIPYLAVNYIIALKGDFPA